MNVRFQVAVVVLDEDGNEVATMWPFNAEASQWVTSCKVTLTQEECENMVEMGIKELERLKARWMAASLQAKLSEFAKAATSISEET